MFKSQQGDKVKNYLEHEQLNSNKNGNVDETDRDVVLQSDEMLLGTEAENGFFKISHPVSEQLVMFNDTTADNDDGDSDVMNRDRNTSILSDASSSRVGRERNSSQQSESRERNFSQQSENRDEITSHRSESRDSQHSVGIYENTNQLNREDVLTKENGNIHLIDKNEKSMNSSVKRDGEKIFDEKDKNALMIDNPLNYAPDEGRSRNNSSFSIISIGSTSPGLKIETKSTNQHNCDTTDVNAVIESIETKGMVPVFDQSNNDIESIETKDREPISNLFNNDMDSSSPSKPSVVKVQYPPSETCEIRNTVPKSDEVLKCLSDSNISSTECNNPSSSTPGIEPLSSALSTSQPRNEPLSSALSTPAPGMKPLSPSLSTSTQGIEYEVRETVQENVNLTEHSGDPFLNIPVGKDQSDSLHSRESSVESDFSSNFRSFKTTAFQHSSPDNLNEGDTKSYDSVDSSPRDGQDPIETS